MKHCVLSLGIVLLAAVVPAYSQQTALEKQSDFIDGKLDTSVMLACSGKIMIIDKDGNETFSYRENVGNVGDGMVLPNGNILFADGDSVVEVTPDKKEVLHFVPSDKRGDSVFSAVRLENGNTLIGWNSQNKIIEINPQGEVVSSFDCQYMDRVFSHSNMRNIRLSRAGTVLVAHKAKGVIAEYSREGKLLKTYSGGEGATAFGVCQLADGSIAGAFLDRVIVFDNDAKEIWQYNKSETTEIEITFMCPIVERKNGNFVLGNYAANRGGTHASLAFEITRNKQIVWQYRNVKGPGSVQGITVLE